MEDRAAAGGALHWLRLLFVRLGVLPLGGPNLE